MDSIFLLEEGDRTVFLLNMMESFGCTYICLWQNFQPSNSLTSLDGIYKGENDAAKRLFEEYRNLWLIMDNGRIPGLAFKNKLPYMELRFADLQSHASNPVQLQFYQEAGIKTAIYMGCSIGEIELGMTSSSPVNLEMEIKNMFPEHFSSQAAAPPAPAVTKGLPHQLLPTDQNRASSSSSFSIDSPEYSSLLFNVNASTSYVPEPPRMEAFSGQTNTRPIPPVSTTAMPYQQQDTIRHLTQIRDLRLPRGETEDAALTRAYLAVMTSPSSSSSIQSCRDNLATDNYQIAAQKATAFRRFRSALGPNVPAVARTRPQNMLKRSIVFFRNLNMISRQEQGQENRGPTITQIHHMISERRRREKLNGSFQLLRSLLPPGTKKDKASVLASTTEYLSSLKAQVEELGKKNEILEAQLVQPQRKLLEPHNIQAGEASSYPAGNERAGVHIINVGESTSSELRIVDLQVYVRGESSILCLVTRLLEFLKTESNVTLESVAANTRVLQSRSVTRITLRLRIEGGEWDESAFQEAVKRVVGDLA